MVSRDVYDIVHKVAAVGSRSIQKAQDFIDLHAGGDKSIKAYGTYAEVYADPDVDAIYIGSFLAFSVLQATTSAAHR